MTPGDLAQISARVEAATPAPWFWNSYSMVQGGDQAALIAWEDGPDYPSEPRRDPAADGRHAVRDGHMSVILDCTSPGVLQH